MKAPDTPPSPPDQSHAITTWERLVRCWLRMDQAEETLKKVYRQLDEAHRLLSRQSPPPHGEDA